MLQNLGEWGTPRLQANLFWKTQKSPCSQKDWNLNPWGEISFHYLSFRSTKLLGGKLSSFRIPPWSAPLWGQPTITTIQLPSLETKAAADHCSWSFRGTPSMGSGTRGCSSAPRSVSTPSTFQYTDLREREGTVRLQAVQATASFRPLPGHTPLGCSPVQETWPQHVLAPNQESEGKQKG